MKRFTCPVLNNPQSSPSHIKHPFPQKDANALHSVYLQEFIYEFMLNHNARAELSWHAVCMVKTNRQRIYIAIPRTSGLFQHHQCYAILWSIKLRTKIRHQNLHLNLLTKCIWKPKTRKLGGIWNEKLKHKPPALYWQIQRVRMPAEHRLGILSQKETFEKAKHTANNP